MHYVLYKSASDAPSAVWCVVLPDAFYLYNQHTVMVLWCCLMPSAA